MSNFNPDKRDLLLIDTLILEAKEKKNKLVGQKIRYQNSLSELKNKYKDVNLNSPDFKRIKNTRQNIKSFLADIDLKIKAINEEISAKNKMRLEVDFHVRNKPSSEEAARLLIKLNGLKFKYQEFAKDRTRVASLRVMANEFISEIDTLINGL